MVLVLKYLALDGKKLRDAIGFEAKILRNTPDVAFESSEFVAGNDVFVHFSENLD